MTKKIEPNIGDRVKDDISGFTGIVTGVVHYISGCDQALVSPSVKEEGTLPSSHWIDFDRLSVTTAAVHKRRAGRRVGFDAPPPIR